MNYPLISEYIEAIKAAGDNFEQLKHLRPVLDGDGQPVMTSGNFAVVFKMKDEQTGKLHAVKCFLREQEGRAEAYHQIAEELEYVSSTFLTPIKYLDKELFVDTSNSDESEFPVLLMDWVEGQTLDKYIREHINDEYELSLLAYQFSRLAMWLLPQPFAHGDLKPDNILVKDDGTLVLVDYDGMYVPAMKGQKARELGSPDFRHPGRTEDIFDEHIDDFSLVSILLSLKAISLQPDLLEQFGASDRLLFSANDYRNLSESHVLDALKTMMQDMELATLYSLFILSAAQNNLSQASFRLLNLGRPDKSQFDVENLSTELTEEDFDNGVEDEFGGVYSKNGEKIINIHPYIEKYSIREGTKCIADGAFSDFGYEIDGIYLKELTIPSSVYLIGHNPFSFWINKVVCKSPHFEIDSDTLFTLGKHRLIQCFSKSEHYLIPDVVEEIDDKAFYGCRMTKITIPDKVKKIGKNPFVEMDLEDRNLVIESKSSLFSVKDNTLYREGTIISYWGKGNYYEVPDGIIEIGAFAFWASGLERIKLPSSIKKIEDGAFDWNQNLKKIIVPTGDVLKFKELLPQYFHDKLVEQDNDCENELLDPLFYMDLEDYLYTKIKQCASKLMLCIEDVQKDELDKKLMYIELTMLSAASVLEMFSAKNDNWQNFIEQKIFNEYVSIKDIEDYDSWIESNTPGLYINDVYIISDGTSLEEFEKVNGPVRFFSGKINAYPYDERLWGEFVDKNGKKQIIYVDQGFPSDYSISDVLNDKQAFAVVEEKDTYYGGDDIVYCLKKIKKEHSMLPDYINERLSFYAKALDDVMSNQNNKEACAFQLYNAVINDRLNYNAPYLGVEDLEFDDDTIVNCQTGEEYHCNATSLDNFTLCIDEVLSNLRNELNVNNPEGNLSTVVTDDDLENAWTDEFGVMYSVDRKRLLYAPEELEDYSIIKDTIVICENAFSGNPDFSYYRLKSINIPNSVQRIGPWAFKGCSNLTSINIPNSIINIGGGAFSDCANLASIIVDDNNVHFDSRDNCNAVIETSTNTLINGCKDTVIPDSVKAIAPLAFRGSGLADLNIPDSVMIIGSGAFQECYYLESIVIPSNVKCIADYTFYACHSLDEIAIPSNVESIGAYAFSQCLNLKKIWFSAYISIIDPSAFIGCKELEYIFIPDNAFDWFEKLLPKFREILMEEVTIENHKGHRRIFSKKELEYVNKAKVVKGQYTKLVCFYMNDYCQKYIPLVKDSRLSIGNEVDLRKAKLIELEGEGINYGYNGYGDYVSKYIVEA